LGINPAMSHEEAFVQAFILPDKRSRYLSMLGSRKRRGGFLDRINHSLDYDSAFAVPIPPAEQTAAAIEALLRKRGAPDECHVISSKSDWDAQDIRLREAIDLILGYGIGTVLCCVPGRLAYYESEDMRRRLILCR
jgi:hypothetical protein